MTRDIKQRTGLSRYQYNDLRATVLFEQDFTCAECPADLSIPEPNYAHLHHIDENPKHNQRSNLLVVCPECHKFPHGYDKRKRNWRKRVFEKYGKEVANKLLMQSEQRREEKEN